MAPPVKMFTLSTCSHCNAAKKMMTECSIRYDFTDVDKLSSEERRAILDEIRKINPTCSFPTIIIGDKVIIGFRENEIREVLGL